MDNKKHIVCLIFILCGLLMAGCDSRSGPNATASSERSLFHGVVTYGFYSDHHGTFHFSKTAVIKADGSLWSIVYIRGETGITRKIMNDVAHIDIAETNLLIHHKDGSLWVLSFRGDWSNPPVKKLDNVVSFAANVNLIMAVTTDGSLWAWRSSGAFYGVERAGVGDGTTEDRNEPTHIMDNVVHISAGVNHSLAVQADGSLWAWGSNQGGQLGTGTTDTELEPVKIMSDVKRVTAGWHNSFAIKTDGSLWAWGNNGFGQIGTSLCSPLDNKTGENALTPVKVFEDAAFVSMGGYRNGAVDKPC